MERQEEKESRNFECWTAAGQEKLETGTDSKNLSPF